MKVSTSEFKIAMWKVRTMFEPDKLQNMEWEMMTSQVNLLDPGENT